MLFVSFPPSLCKLDCTFSHFEHSSSCPTCRKQLGENDFTELVVADNYEALKNENTRLKQQQTSLRLQYEQNLNDMQNKLMENDIDGSATDGNRTDGNGIDGSATDGSVTDGNGTDGNGTDGNGTAVDAANLHNKTKVCKYYFRGGCHYGNECWNSHEPTNVNLENVGERKRTRGGHRHNKNKGSDGG